MTIVVTATQHALRRFRKRKQIAPHISNKDMLALLAVNVLKAGVVKSKPRWAEYEGDKYFLDYLPTAEGGTVIQVRTVIDEETLELGKSGLKYKIKKVLIKWLNDW